MIGARTIAFHGPPREDQVPAEPRENEDGRRPAAGREERAPEEGSGGERGDSPERGREANAEDRRVESAQAEPVELQVENADGAVRLRDAERSGPDSIGEVPGRSGERERRRNEGEIVDPEGERDALEPDEPEERPQREGG